MIKLRFPFVNLPQEFVILLKSNISVSSSPAPILDLIRSNKALYSILETAFKEFDNGKGLEKVIMALGWANFRERMASVYIYKSIYGDYPGKTDMELVEEIKALETRFADHSVTSFSRLFLLGFYLKMANIEIQQREENKFLEIKIPQELGPMLKLSQGRSERIDWLILILLHLNAELGEKMLMNNLANGKKFEELYALMPKDAQEIMGQNLMAYSASIQEPEVFLYEKV
ncbi:MAG: hypothetical protein H0V66_08180 [Bdellovibrionales bacterium]|nr:hypothetical protein [Bdellovibrionales bacterium]